MEIRKIIGKKTMGRRRIEMRKIEKKSSLQVTFTKRRMGLFRKASELSVLCGAEIAILVRSPADKIFSYGHPSVESLAHRFQTGGAAALIIVPYRDNDRSRYEEAARKLEIDKRMNQESRTMRSEFWWDEPFESMGLHELEEYVEAMVVLKDNISHRVEEMEKLKSMPNIDTSNFDRNFQINYQDFDGCKREFEVMKVEPEEYDHIKEQMKKDIIGSCSSSNFITDRTDDDDVLNYDEFFDFQSRCNSVARLLI